MKREKIGDVYSVKVPNGYKLYQWAYSIPQKGDYIRVFDGLYASVPENLSEIVVGPHSYIISFDSRRAYRKGLAQLLCNFPIPDEYPFPELMLTLYPKTGGVGRINIMSTSGTASENLWFRTNKIQDLPIHYQNITLLNSCVTPNWLLYLFDINFNLNNLDCFFPCKPGENVEEKLQKYTDIINAAMAPNAKG